MACGRIQRTMAGECSHSPSGLNIYFRVFCTWWFSGLGGSIIVCGYKIQNSKRAEERALVGKLQQLKEEFTL